MRQYFGSVLFAFLAIAAGIIGWLVGDIHHAWIWWLLGGLIAIGFIVAACLSFPSRESSPPAHEAPRSVFIKGDADGSILHRVKSNADDFIGGNARDTYFGDITHDRNGD
jgi:hypothetical protein